MGLVAALTALLILPSSSLIFANDQRLVTVYYDEQERSMRTSAESVGDVLDQLDIVLGEGDIAEPGLDAQIDLSVYHINVYRSRAVKVIDGNTERLVLSAYRNPQLIAEEAGIEVFPEDNLDSYIVQDFTREGFVGEKVIIKRATPLVLDFDNHTKSVRTHLDTVGEVLAENDISLRSEDFTKPGLESSVAPDMNVRVVRVGKEIVTEEQGVVFDIKTVIDYNMPAGLSEVEKKGEEGRVLQTFEVERHNGQEVSREKISKTTLKEPVTQVVKRGGQVASNLTNKKESLMRQAGIPSSAWSYADHIIAKESGWNHLVHNMQGSSAYGLCQALPGSKMSSAGADWRTNPVTQLRWCNDYAVGRYGSWSAAHNFWINNHWW